MLARPRAALAALPIALAATACMPAYFRDVPPSFVEIDAPVSQISPSPHAATVVVYGSASFGVERNTQQAITFVLADGTALAQVPRFAWASFEVPQGYQTVAAGVPEIGDVRPCNTITGNFEAGKIYVLTRALTPPARDDRPERWLSLMSRLRVDRAAGQARVREQWEGFWAPCIERSKAARSRLDPQNGRSELVIPPPP